VKQPAARGARRSVLARLQLGIEALYRVETRLEIESFVIDERARSAVSPTRRPREQLLVTENADELSMALFVDPATLDNLERNDPGRRLDDRNFSDFCLAVEGVSHFIYLALCAARERCVSPLELELQAEVDKFICCLLLAGSDRSLRRRLYGEVRFAPDLDEEERQRYRTANQEANRYADMLERRFVGREPRDGITAIALLAELRRFYRMDLSDKLGHIGRVSSAA
jgi:hypothetical protein